MRNSKVGVPVAVASCLAVAVCGGSDPLGPVEPEDVSITVAVSGGLAGVDYAFEVDGVTKSVRGVSCRSFCDFNAGEVLMVISSAQVSEFARLLDEAGVMDLDGRDFGVGCCDFLHVDLTYTRGERSSHVRGTQDRLPDDLNRALRVLEPLARRTVPMLISPETGETEWPRAPYTLGGVLVEGLTLTAEVTYGGGCGEHRMDLVALGGWLESYPVQVDALVSHNDGDDPCDAVVAEDRRFDLFPLVRAYVAAYGDVGLPRPTVILRLRDPGSGDVRLVEVGL